MTKILREALAALFVIAVMVIASLETIGAQEDPPPSLHCSTEFWGPFAGRGVIMTGFTAGP